MKELKLTLKDNVARNIEKISRRVGGLEKGTRKAFTLLDIALTHQDKGGTLIFRHKNGEEEPLTVK